MAKAVDAPKNTRDDYGPKQCILVRYDVACGMLRDDVDVSGS